MWASFRRSVLFVFMLFLFCDAIADIPPAKLLICLGDNVSRNYMHDVNPGMKTPIYDRIAHESVVSNNAYAESPNCTHSRTMWLTGDRFFFVFFSFYLFIFVIYYSFTLLVGLV